MAELTTSSDCFELAITCLVSHSRRVLVALGVERTPKFTWFWERLLTHEDWHQFVHFEHEFRVCLRISQPDWSDLLARWEVLLNGYLTENQERIEEFQASVQTAEVERRILASVEPVNEDSVRVCERRLRQAQLDIIRRVEERTQLSVIDRWIRETAAAAATGVEIEETPDPFEQEPAEGEPSEPTARRSAATRLSELNLGEQPAGTEEGSEAAAQDSSDEQEDDEEDEDDEIDGQQNLAARPPPRVTDN